MSKVRQRVPGDGLGMGTAAPDSHPTPSSEPRPNLDQLGMGTCICCVCCTSSTSDKLQPSAAVISAGLQKASSDPIIQSTSEMQKCGRAHRLCCPPLLYTCAARALQLSAPPAVLGQSGCPSWPPQPHTGCSVHAALRAAGPLFAPSLLAVREAFPPTHQQQVLSLRSNAGTESIPRQMFLRPLTQDCFPFCAKLPSATAGTDDTQPSPPRHGSRTAARELCSNSGCVSPAQAQLGGVQRCGGMMRR